MAEQIDIVSLTQLEEEVDGFGLIAVDDVGYVEKSG